MLPTRTRGGDIPFSPVLLTEWTEEVTIVVEDVGTVVFEFKVSVEWPKWETDDDDATTGPPTEDKDEEGKTGETVERGDESCTTFGFILYYSIYRSGNYTILYSLGNKYPFPSFCKGDEKDKKNEL